MERHSSALGNCTLGGTIQAGSLWKVKVATNNLTAEEVAIKIIKSDLAKSMMGLEEKGAFRLTCSARSSSKHLTAEVLICISFLT